MRKRGQFNRKRSATNPWRSGFERDTGADLDSRGVKFQFEPFQIKFRQPAKDRTYTPDFVLENGIIIETKGEFTLNDRQKHLWVRDDNPELDIRFVFVNAQNKIYKTSKTTYGDWCDTHEFLWAHRKIPQEWCDE